VKSVWSHSLDLVIRVHVTHTAHNSSCAGHLLGDMTMRRQPDNSDETCIRVYIGEVDRLCRHGVCNRRPPGTRPLKGGLAPSASTSLHRRASTSIIDMAHRVWMPSASACRVGFRPESICVIVRSVHGVGPIGPRPHVGQSRPRDVGRREATRNVGKPVG
jgi:hypothetical protein